MLEIQIKPNENEIIIFNNSTEDYRQVTIHYFDHGEKWGEFGFDVLPAKTNIRLEVERLSNKSIAVESLVVTSQGILLQYFSKGDAEGNLTVINKELIPKEAIVKLVLSNKHCLLSHTSSTNLGKEIFTDFINRIFAFIDTEYHEDNQGWNYGYYLKNIFNIHLEQSQDTTILLSKCVILMDFLNLSKDEMATYVTEFISHK